MRHLFDMLSPIHSLSIATGILAFFGGCAALTYRHRFAQMRARLLQEREQFQFSRLGLDEKIHFQTHSLEAKERQLASARDELFQLQERIAQMSNQLGRCQAQLDEEAKRSKERADWTSAQQNEWLLRFQGASEQLLSNSKALFLEQNQQQLTHWREGVRSDHARQHQHLESMLAPLRECIDRLQRERRGEESQWSEVYGALKEQLRGQAENHLAIQREMQQLSQALRTPQGCGRWGELQLKRVVEIAGMLPYCDFDQQVTRAHESGHLRPDMIIRLPSQRQLIIDAKAPIQAYLEAQFAKEEQQRSVKLKEHAEAVRKHAQILAQKEYWQSFKPTPEFTVLFLPGEAIFSAALEADPLLMEWSARKNIILATPTTLIALLKAIAYGWRQHRSEENSRQIAQLGSQLYERLKKFGHYLDDLRRHLNQTVNTFNTAVGSWDARILVAARKLHESSDLTEGGLSSPKALDVEPKSRRLGAIEAPRGELEHPIGEIAPVDGADRP